MPMVSKNLQVLIFLHYRGAQQAGWKPGTIVRITSSAVWIGAVPNG